jgi:FkbM family methyltransferase
MPVYVRPGTSDFLVVQQLYERLELDFVEPYSPRTILDGGANIGLASQIFGYMFPSATVIAVEAASNNYEMLRLNTAHLPNVIPLHAGIWPRTTALHVTNTAEGEWAHILEEVDTCSVGMECVNAVTIDLIQDLFNINNFDFIKLDIEASEKGVFTNDSSNQLQWLDGVHVLAIELHDRYIPGCSKAVTNALTDSFQLTKNDRSEYVVATRKKEFT